jgi:hypothetical protein
MDVNIEIDELVVEDAEHLALVNRLTDELGPLAARAVDEAVASAVRARTDGPPSAA